MDDKHLRCNWFALRVLMSSSATDGGSWRGKLRSDLTLRLLPHIRSIGIRGASREIDQYSRRLALLAASTIGTSSAQQSPKAKTPARSAQTTPSAAAAPAPAPPADNAGAAATGGPPSGWAARCGSISRDAPLECAIEQTAVLTKTGQTVVLVNIRVPSDIRAAVMTVQPARAVFAGRRKIAGR